MENTYNSDIFYSEEEGDDYDDEAYNSSQESGSSLKVREETSELYLKKIKGRISRILHPHGYGFIELVNTPETTVYFDFTAFEKKQEENFRQLCDGDTVILNAEKTDGHKAQYRATRIWGVKHFDSSFSSSRSSYSSTTSLASNQEEIINCVSYVKRIHGEYGFVTLKDKKRDVFFHKNKVKIPDGTNLADFLKVGDTVYVNAITSRKKADRLEATILSKTALLISESTNGYNDFNTSTKNCAFGGWENSKSGMDTLDEIKVQEVLFNENNLTKSTNYSTDVKACSSNLITAPVGNENSVCDAVGKIYLKDEGDYVAQIKFGENNKEIAMVKPNIIYNNKQLIQDIFWELTDGQTVNFNAHFESKLWITTLVWIGQKPELTIENKEQTSKMSENSESKNPLSVSTNLNKFDENSENWPSLDSVFVSDFKEVSDNSTKIKITDFDLNDTSKTEVTYDKNVSYAKATTKSNNKTIKHKKKSKNKDPVNKLKVDLSDKGWNSDSFNVKCEEWPELNETPKTSTHKIKTEKQFSAEGLSENTQKSKMTSGFQDIADLLTEESSDVECIYDKFTDLTGKILNIGNKSAFVQSDHLNEETPFYWEDAYCDGIHVCEHYTGLNEVFDELEQIHFNYIALTNRKNRSWNRISLIWKGSKPNHVVEITPEEFAEVMGLKLKPCISSSSTILTKENKTPTSSQNTTLVSDENIDKIPLDENIDFDEESSKKEAETNDTNKGTYNITAHHDENLECNLLKKENCNVFDEKKTDELSKRLFSGFKERKHETKLENHSSDFEVTDGKSDSTENELKVKLMSSKQEYSEPIKLYKVECINCGKQRTAVDKITETEKVMCNKETQTFSTGKVLSFDLFPH